MDEVFMRKIEKTGQDTRMLLFGPEGVVQFVYMISPLTGVKMGMDVGYHSRRPLYAWASPMECPYLPEGECYYDGSGLHAVEVLHILENRGEEDVWKHLENYYMSLFNGKEV